MMQEDLNFFIVLTFFVISIFECMLLESEVSAMHNFGVSVLR